MANFNYACRVIKADDGTEIIKCRDFPELLSWSVDGKSLETWAKYAIEDCLNFRMKDRMPIPEASPAQEEEFVVELELTQVAKILLSNEMVSRGISRAELSRLSGVRLPELTRLLNIHHATKIDRLDGVMRTIGKKLVLSIG